ncbi:MAG: UDP-N-acetylglucosamine 1-carboxyvinyltransferase [Geodermatophilaceae bacterium]|nr:UDP-N-acetylglucosamine 1-carboxyvinyltransferase [Geodermatophilaceae bacterium]
MNTFAVNGGARLVGTATVTGAKNSALKLMAAALLAEGTSTISAVPEIADVAIMGEVLRRLGCDVELDHGQESGAGSARIGVPQRLGTETDYELVRRMRAAICVLGPLLARCGRATVPLPGGDNIGSRGLDLHIAGLHRLGADIRNEHGFLIATADALVGATVWLDFPSVGATENLLMAGVLAKGTTVIDNAAREPEIADLVSMLVAMGAKIDGAGTSTLEIVGVEGLQPVQHTTVPDRVVAGTLAYGAVMTGGDVLIRNGRTHHLDVPLGKLTDAGAEVTSIDGGFRIVMDRRPRAVDIVTLPYPGFPTDLQPMAVGLAAVSEGSSLITENVFEARFMFVNELVRLGAEVQVDGHHVVVRGHERLSSAPVEAHDIRAGAGLVLAGLVADGRTEVSGGHHIVRGYPDFAGQLRALGADVTLNTTPDA